MSVELYAVCSGFFYACSNVLVKIGLVKDSKANAITATLLTMATNFVFMWLVYLLTAPPAVVLEALLVFSLSGVIAQGVARSLNYIGIEKLGVAISAPISSTTPLFEVITAVILLGETFSPQIGIGLILVVIGIIIISRRRAGQDKRVGWSKWNLLFPLGAASFRGLTTNMRKIGLNTYASPISGATIGISAALGVYIPTLVVSGKIREVSVRRTSFWFLLAGLCTGIAWLFNFGGLALGTVSSQAPIRAGSNPLISLLLTSIFLRDTEKITVKTVAGAIAIISGAMIIALFK